MPWHELSGRGLGVRTITVQGFGRPSVGIVRASLPFFFICQRGWTPGKWIEVFSFTWSLCYARSHIHIFHRPQPESPGYRSRIRGKRPSRLAPITIPHIRKGGVWFPLSDPLLRASFHAPPFFDLHLAVGTRSSGTATGSAWRSLVLRRVASRTAPGRCAPILTIRMIRYIAQNHFF